MKNKLLLFFLLVAITAWGQTTIFSENMGTGASGNPTVSAYSGFQNYGTLVFSGTGDLRSSVNSDGYLDASGGNNVMLNANTETLIIDGIDATSYSDLVLTFGVRKSTTAENGTGLVVEYSTSGASGTFTAISKPNLTTGSGSTIWYQRSSTSVIPNNITTIRFRSTNGVEWRIDDVILTGTLPSCAAPTVALQTTPVQDVSATGANLYGDVTGVGGGTAVTQRGFQYATNANMTSALTVQENNGTGTYNLAVGSLTRNTKYFYRAFAINDCATPQTGYSSTTPVSNYFVTKQVATTANDATNIESYSFRANWVNPSSGGGSETFTYKLVVERFDGSSWVAFDTYTGISSATNYYDVNTGLTPNTLYRYYFYSVNEGGESDLPSSIKEVRTLPTIGWANLQWPPSGTINEGGTFDVYGQVWAAGLTDVLSENPGAILQAEIGLSPVGENSHPDTWVNWTTATWNAQVGNNDEYKAAIGSSLAPGVYRYAFRYRIGTGAWVYGGTGGIWSTDSGVLTVNSLISWANYQHPCTGTSILGTVYDVYGRIDASGITSGAGHDPSIQAQVGYVLNTDSDPRVGSGWTWVDAQPNSSQSGLGNIDEYMHNIGQHFTVAGTYYMAFRYRVGSGAWYYGGRKNGVCDGTGGGEWNGTTNINASVVINAPSNTSDIIISPSFTYPTNIAYANYQAANIIGGAADIEVGRFILRDGGGTVDADPLGTTLNNLTMTLQNPANVRRVAIYDGATEIQELAGAATLNFTGLNLVAPDDGTKEFSVRVSFNSEVTDNEQIQFTITNATTIATGSSTFATSNAGNANTSVAGDNNRIEVTADRIAFVQEPSDTNINVAMTPAVTISANDILGNRDLDFTGVVEVTSDGTLTGDPVSINAINGLATFSDLIHTVEGTGLQLLAASGTWDVLSTSFNVVEILIPSGSYRTTSNGTWPAGTASWERLSGVTWSTSTAPTSGTTDLLIIRHAVTTRAAFAASGGVGTKILVENGGVFTNNHNSTLSLIHVKDGGTFVVEVTGVDLVSTGGTKVIENGGTLIINASLTNSSQFWSGDEDFQEGSTVEIKAYSGILLASPSQISANANNYLFGNLKFSGNTAITIVGTNTGSDFYLTENNLEVNSTSNNILIVSSASKNIFINGNTIVNAGILRGMTSLSSITINGNLETNNNGTVNIAPTNNGSIVYGIKLNGNLIMRDTSSLITSDSDSELEFNGIGDGLTSETTQFIDVVNTSNITTVKMKVNSGAYVKLINQNLFLGTNAAFNVKNGSVLDFGFNASDDPLIITNSGSGQFFTADSGSTLKITSPDGITTTANLGNVQTPVTNRTFAADATYHYIGKANQSTGNAIASSGTPLTGKVIVEMDNPSLTFTAFDTRNINTPGTLEIRKGIVNDSSLNGFVGSGNLTMNSNDGRYITSRTGLQPELQGTYTLTAGTIEFANTSSTAQIRVTPDYYNIDVSGNNIKPGGLNLVVNNLTQVIGTGKLSFPETADNASPYVLFAKKGIQVASGATALFEHNAQLMQDTDALNLGNIKMGKKFTFSPEREQYNFANSPVVGLNITGIYPGDPLAQYYNEPNNKFIYYDGAYLAGRGVALSEPSTDDVSTSSVVSEFVGVPFNGTLTMTGLTNGYTGFHLIGNPYPSQLDLDLLYEDNDEVLETRFLFWDNRGNPQITQYGDGYNGNHYAQYNVLGGTGTAAANGIIEAGVYTPRIPNGKVAVGSAVMVRFLIDAPANGNSIVLNNTQRTTGSSVNFFGRAATQTEKDRYWLTMDTPGDLSVMNAVVYFEGGNNGFGMDDNTSAGGSDDFYTMAENKKLAIQGKAPFEVSDTITVGYKAFERGAYKINLHQFEGVFAENIHIHLIDNETSTAHNLSEDGSYHFESEAGEFQNRFFIVYETEEVEEPEEPLANIEFNKSGLAVYKHGKETVILSKELNLHGLQVYNLQGQLLFDKEDIHQKSYRFDNNRFVKQTLILVVKTTDGKEHNFKVLTH